MGKLTNMVIFISILVLLFHFAGLIDGDTPISFVIDMLLNPSSFQTHSLYTELVAALALIAGTGAVIGLFTPGRPDMVIKAGMITVLITVGWDFLVIFQKVSEVSYPLATIVISPFIITFILTLVEWWGGTD